ncbi:MAG: hypothetical protein LBI19_02845 [Oscillospiraceae bacterium]|jgi:hypothetical protein|nr:hypothetical protein [Oscillospiraceae bacterium]
MTEIRKLEKMGVRFRLAVDCELPPDPPPEARALLERLSIERDAVIRDLAQRMIAVDGGLYELPRDVPIPGEWEIQRLAQQVWEEANKGQGADLKKIYRAASTIYLYASGASYADEMRGIYDQLHIAN